MIRLSGNIELNPNLNLSTDLFNMSVEPQQYISTEFLETYLDSTVDEESVEI